MSYKQLVQPNLNATGQVGLCLAFAEDVFNTAREFPYATKAWQATKYRHLDQNFPSDVAVLLWWSYKQNGADYGHVAIHVPGKGILSSPWQKGTTHAWLPTIAKLESIYSDGGIHPLTFLGWSEDLAGVRVAEPIAPPHPSAGRVLHKGTATVTTGPLNVRTAPSTASQVVAEYNKGQTFSYDSYLITNGYVWLSYVSASGVRHYIAEGPDDGNEANVWVKGGV
jgi:hypothetical protein